MQFEGKVVVVTGASSGIGRAAALAFAREGAAVALADTDAAAGEQAAEEIRRSGVDAEVFATDVSREADVQALVEAVLGRWGRLDVLVNNAGIYLQADAVATTESAWNRLMAVNLTGAFLCIKHAVPAMMRGKGGAIVNVASEAGLVGIRNQVAYNVSKAGPDRPDQELRRRLRFQGNPRQLRLPGHDGHSAGTRRRSDARLTPRQRGGRWSRSGPPTAWARRRK